ncbi:DUF1097 domain-containing protein [Thermoplasmatales archaeon SW_10_69_26]|nr:MAG: DUF1097 domain-containing protein [Thermoplasmatales archaeon SW_10_69_26]
MTSQASEDGRALALAVVFGLLSVPWTFGFELVPGLPLWPAFVASASVFAAGGGADGFARSLTNNALGAGYAAATLLVVAWAGAGIGGLSLAVGAFMFLASLHALVDALSFTPAVFLGYASLFGVDAGIYGLVWAGLAGTLTAALAAMAIGAGLGWLAETLADRLAALTTPGRRT